MRKFVLGVATLATVFFSACSDDDDATVVTTEAGTIQGGPFTFIVDGNPDNVSGITFLDEGVLIGANSAWVITDNSQDPVILGAPATIADLEAVNFDSSGGGICRIWYLRYNGTLPTITAGSTRVSALTDANLDFDLSNSIEVTRNGPLAGQIQGGTNNTFTFNVQDGVVDNVSGIEFVDASVQVGDNSTFVITDNSADPVILGTPPTIAALEMVDFDSADPGNCLIWYLRYNGTLPMITPETTRVSALVGTEHHLSNSITVVRN